MIDETTRETGGRPSWLDRLRAERQMEDDPGHPAHPPEREEDLERAISGLSGQNQAPSREGPGFQPPEKSTPAPIQPAATPGGGGEKECLSIYGGSVERMMARYVHDNWTQAGTFAYRLETVASTSSSEGRWPSVFASAHYNGGFADLRKKLASAPLPEMKDVFQSLCAGFIADQALAGQFATSQMAVAVSANDLEAFERLAALKARTEGNAVKSMEFMMRLRSPPGLTITTSQVNVAANQQVVNNPMRPVQERIEENRGGRPAGVENSHELLAPREDLDDQA